VADSKAVAADAKAELIDKAAKRLIYTVVLSDAEGQFTFGKSALPEPAKAKIDQLVTQLKADPNGAYLEIEGHTDSIGSKAVNHRIGLERAEAVKRYLFETHQIPLHKMSVFSYGMEKPAVPNNTKDGRAQNRRVVIRVLT
jgi:outer membrane protein OmpA-like peptidoglycan-associated protein